MMPSKQSTVDALLDRLRALEDVSARKMFGEYGLYCGAKMVGSICDDIFYLKITEAGKTFAGKDYQEGCPYPGAKPAIRIDAQQLADPAWLSELVKISAANLPAPKPKKTRQAK